MKKIKESKSLSIMVIIIAYILALSGGLYVFQILPGEFSILIRTLIADLSAAAIIFLFSAFFNNSSCYDAYWSIAPPLIFLFWITLSRDGESIGLRSILVLALTIIWALRLTANWIISWPGLIHEDWRFVDMRKKLGRFYWPVSLLGLHIFPTLLVYICSIPAYFALLPGSRPFNIFDGIGIGAAITAVFFEWKSDLQLSEHRKSSNRNKPIESGLWKYSRHPNYFGEILFWFSLYFFSVAAAPGYFWIIIAPVIMLFQFVFVSIPIMEKRQMERKEDYVRIQKTISMLFPLPPRKEK